MQPEHIAFFPNLHSLFVNLFMTVLISSLRTSALFIVYLGTDDLIDWLKKAKFLNSRNVRRRNHYSQQQELS